MTKTFHRGKAETKTQPPLSRHIRHIIISGEEMQKIKDISFAEGKKEGVIEGHIQLVADVETIMAKELGFPSREELVNSGKMPALWIAALVKCYGEDYEERIRRKAAEAEPAKPRRQ